MGKGNWFSSIKKALSPNSKAKKAKREAKLENERPSVSYTPPKPEPVVEQYRPHPDPHPLPTPLVVEDENVTEIVENDQTNHAYSVAAATAAAAEAAVAAANAAAEVVRLTSVTQLPGKSKEELAAIRIQTIFRGYMARRALRALRGLVRLKSLVDGPTVNRQTANTLKCMQTVSRVQSQIQSRRIRMLEENKALQRQLLQNRAKELGSLTMGEDWNDSHQSKEEIEVKLMHKFEAAMRRERALAYSYTHQQTWKKSAKPTNLLFMDPTNPQWGWSWLERWMAARPWETQTTPEKTPNNYASSVGEITKSFARHQLNSEDPSSPSSQTPPTRNLSSNPPSKQSSSVPARKLKSASPRGSSIAPDDDSRSVFSVQSEKNRRHSIAGSSVRDDESLASTSNVPSYMASTHSAKAKLRLPSPLGMENGNTPEKGSMGSAKKRLSYPSSPARPRRHSGPPKVDTSSIAGSEITGVVN